MVDHNGKTWTRDGDKMTCADGRTMMIHPDMTDAYLMGLIERMEAPAVPQSVSMRQARLALLGAGLLSTVNAAIAGMDGVEGEAARIEWEYAQDVDRGSALIGALSPLLGMTSEQLDALFIAAAAL